MIIEPKGVNGFLAIVENGNFEKAAKKLGITTSALSIRVSTLEKLIGGKLLIRKRPFILTETGHLLYNHALQLRELECSLKQKIDKIST
ncbi:LysR family transcriptional regulator [Rouxiella silvae]|jgi:DNA-binding transcriptional LysR family regulator|uniref:LysR family transcriptional regulator n=1 Tax=Rouxiella silvae TaxID=1646373 RepID=A0AA41BY91_9GAMM|nr:LysR family transcriptional regulator [Rouxiella silvae]MBF6638398.1 LysR family transcriptional regulator [Rouxiella silvae]ORJ18958.1 LysR family transcriptional regulator [Rouxiella silvae]